MMVELSNEKTQIHFHAKLCIKNLNTKVHCILYQQ